MADENKTKSAERQESDEVLENDPLTGGKTVAQTPTDEAEITPLPETVQEDGDNTRAGDFDQTTGAAHPSEDADTE
jgi:hypothetical protein